MALGKLVSLQNMTLIKQFCINFFNIDVFVIASNDSKLIGSKVIFDENVFDIDPRLVLEKDGQTRLMNFIYYAILNDNTVELKNSNITIVMQRKI